MTLLFLMPSFFLIFLRCVSTVLMETLKLLEMSLLEKPERIILLTSISLLDNAPSSLDIFSPNCDAIWLTFNSSKSKVLLLTLFVLLRIRFTRGNKSFSALIVTDSYILIFSISICPSSSLRAAFFLLSFFNCRFISSLLVFNYPCIRFLSEQSIRATLQYRSDFKAAGSIMIFKSINWIS